jgi:hypothetical protein
MIFVVFWSASALGFDVEALFYLQLGMLGLALKVSSGCDWVPNCSRRRRA